MGRYIYVTPTHGARKYINPAVWPYAILRYGTRGVSNNLETDIDRYMYR